MRTKFILTSFALTAALVGCTQDELTTANENVENQSGMIELGENFMIGTVGVTGASTRTHWELSNGALTNVYSPIAVDLGGNNSILVSGADPQLVNAPSIGLCWVGQSVGDQVYTNYEFYHNGWLGKDQTKALFDPCDDSKLKNGWLYSDLRLTAASTAGEEAVTKALLTSGITSAASKVDEKDGTTTLSLTDMNLNSGLYKTENKAIFGGNYIAYYPYNPDFKDAGTIPAKSEVVFTDLKKNNPGDFKLAENTFRYTNVASIDGGAQAKGFGFKNLSGVIRLVLKSKSNTALSETVDKVILYSASSAFKKEVRLSAAKINAGATGTALYASTEETSKTILAEMENSNALSVVAANATGTTLNAATVYLTALPTAVSDLVILAHETSGKWAEYTIGSTEIPAGAGKEIVASFASADFKTIHYAVDQATLTAAITAIGSATKTDPATIKVLGDIVLNANTKITSFVTVEGDKIIVPEDITLTLDDNATMKSTVDVQGQTCCGSSSDAGKMIVNAATVAGNVNVLAGYTDKKSGTLNFATDKTSLVASTATIVSDGSVDFAGITDIFGTLTLNAGGTAVLSGDNSDVNVKGGTVNNNGTFTVDKGKFAMLDASGNTVAAAGKNFKNNGTFIDNIGTTIGGATQYMTFGEKGDYICKVNVQARLDEAYKNKEACSTIQFVNTATATYDLKNAAKHNDKFINIVDNGVLTIIKSTTTVNIGNLNVMKTRTLKIATATKAINVNGDIVLDGSFTTEEDVQGISATNLTINDGGAAVFENRSANLGVTLAVAQTIEVKKDGKFTMTAASAGKNVADVTCKKLIEGGTFVGKPRVIE